MREQVAHFNTALAVMLKFPRALEQVPSRTRHDSWHLTSKWLPMIPSQQWLGIKGVNLTRTTMQKHKNNSLGTCRKLWSLGRQRIQTFFAFPPTLETVAKHTTATCHRLLGKQTQKRQIPEPKSTAPQ